MKSPPVPRQDRRTDSIKSHHIEEHRHDPYKARGKLTEPSQCPTCKAVFHEGRWQWSSGPVTGAHQETCPACHRIADNYPAGEVTLSGGFVAQHSDDLVNLIRNTERKEKVEHPLQRVMAIDEREGRIVVTTTDIHLPRRIAHAIKSAYDGDLDMHYDEAGYFVRIAWNRAR